MHQLVSVGELVEVVLNFLHAMKVVSPKDLGSTVHPSTWHYSLKVPAPSIKLWVLGTF